MGLEDEVKRMEAAIAARKLEEEAIKQAELARANEAARQAQIAEAAKNERITSELRLKLTSFWSELGINPLLQEIQRLHPDAELIPTKEEISLYGKGSGKRQVGISLFRAGSWKQFYGGGYTESYTRATQGGEVSGSRYVERYQYQERSEAAWTINIGAKVARDGTNQFGLSLTSVRRGIRANSTKFILGKLIAVPMPTEYSVIIGNRISEKSNTYPNMNMGLGYIDSYESASDYSNPAERLREMATETVVKMREEMRQLQ